MIRAQFELGWLKIDCSGADASETFLQIYRKQDLDCLVNQAQMFGEEKKANKLKHEYIEPAQEGTLTIEKLRKLNIAFEPGRIRCIRAEETDE